MATTLHKQVLIHARALIGDPAHWTRGTLARDADERSVAWHDDLAIKWCAVGAIYRAAYQFTGSPELGEQIGNEVIKRLRRPRLLFACLGRGLPSINDIRGHRAVLAEFDKALGSV